MRRRLVGSALVLVMVYLDPGQARTISNFARTCASWLTSDSGTYETARMALPYHLLDLTVSYVPRSRLPELAIEYDAIDQTWIYSLSKEKVEPGSYMFVMDPRGQLYVLRTYAANRHHSSFLRGRPVASAGHLQFDQSSRLASMSTATGHYYRGFRDSCQNWRQFVSELRSRQVLTGRIEIEEVRGSMLRPQPTEVFYVSNEADLTAPCRDRAGLLDHPVSAAVERAGEDGQSHWRVTTSFLTTSGRLIRPFRSFTELRRFFQRHHEDLLPQLDAREAQISFLLDAQFHEHPVLVEGLGLLKVVGIYPTDEGADVKFEDTQNNETNLSLTSLGRHGF